jgi:peptide deformylase
MLCLNTHVDQIANVCTVHDMYYVGEHSKGIVLAAKQINMSLLMYIPLSV